MLLTVTGRLVSPRRPFSMQTECHVTPAPTLYVIGLRDSQAASTLAFWGVSVHTVEAVTGSPTAKITR